ncbi:copper amine oxidase N-terminal domain-containing protein [Anaerovorax sp. IOR16]|uniref:copper amine oxidase N-terminal domain-containing protein n=1 Tax=Anaerovorax sp. IOR16 TaxID=2773458 RepID=UPI001FD69E84|nr:copper amine oxidase N-terminal domain-containing protein [Anaerovorax sp. IOR16]
MNKDKIKGFLSGMIVTTLVLGLSLTSFAETGTKNLSVGYSNIKIYINEKLTAMKDPKGNTVEPFIYNGTTYVPLRAVSEALGQEVSWNNSTKSIYIGTQPADISNSKEEYEFANGNYTSGIDFSAGTYTITAIKGGGNVSSSNLLSGGINAIMGTPDKNSEIGLDNFYKQEYKNISLPSGTILKIDGVTIKLTKVK